jgi:uncharacterized protein YjiS (DUF1127 family)
MNATIWKAVSSPRVSTAGHAAPGWRPVLGRALELLLTWQIRAFERRHLRELDDRLLADIGLSRADVEGESRKPFWRT